MKHTIKELGDCKVEITVEVDPKLWADTQAKAFDKALANVQIKGFRKGKAPKAMAASYVDPNRVMNLALQDVLNPVYATVLSEEKLQPYSRPDVNVSKVSDKDLTLVFTVTLLPKVTLGDYKGIKAKKAAVSVKEEEIADAIAKRLANAGELALVDRAAKKGDTVVLDFKGYVDGKPFDGGEANNYSLELGSNSFVPGFEDALIGVKAGDQKDVNIVFPEQYVKELAGKPATFKCAIHEVKEKSVPALTDEAVADFGLKDVKTVAELKEYEKKNLLQNKEEQASRDYYNEIVKKIVDNAKAEIASEIVDHEAADQEEQTKQQVEQNGLTFDQYLQITGQTAEQLKKTLREQSAANLKTYLVLNAIAAKENMIVDEAELNVELSKMAEQYKMKLDDIKKALGNNLSGFRENLQNRKIQEFLLANNGEAPAAKKVSEKGAEKKEEKPAEAKKAPAKKAPAKKAEAKKAE